MPYCSICKKVVPDLDHHCEWCAAARRARSLHVAVLVRC
jgi:hypothetical protein